MPRDLQHLKWVDAKIRTLGWAINGLRIVYHPFLQLLLKLQTKLTFLTHRKHFWYDYRPRPDDLFIVTFGKSGTTWMQMIIHQLLSCGDLDFTHISEVSPSFEGWREDAFESLASPRVFKSHLTYEEIPKAQVKYIYVYRDPADVLVSLYHHEVAYNGYQGEFHEYFKVYRKNAPQWTWANHVAGWLQNRHQLKVLYLRYEDMIRDLQGSIGQIVEFCGLAVPDAEMPRILTRSSFKFMKANESKFDEATQKMLDAGWKKGNFIRNGRTREAKAYLNEEQLDWIESEKTRCGLKALSYE